MEAICTIITGNYGHYALALHDSILQFNSAIPFYVFVSEGILEENIKEEISKRPTLNVLNFTDFIDSELTKKLYDKYATNFHDALRWSMKPVVMNYLLSSTYERVIYVDCDIHFFDDFNFLLEDLKKYSILLSPHWRSSNPKADVENFKLNFLDGIYNGGFIGASRYGREALNYWADLCLFNCEVKRNKGFYVDQRYLDILPTRFSGIGHIEHKGCNVANWNIVDCKRVLQDNGNVLINNKYPIVFIHFTNSLFKGAYISKADTLLIPYIEQYRDIVLKYNDKDIIDEFFKKGVNVVSRKELEKVSQFKKSFIYKIAWLGCKKIIWFKRKINKS